VAPDSRAYAATAIVLIVVLFLVRLAVAAATPLSLDEALYWMWSKHLAGGYLDHPPMTPILIRLGTSLFGDTEFGVRFLGVLLSLPATYAVWRSATILFDDDRIGATAGLLFTLTLAIAVGSVLMTPDNPVLVTTTFLLLCLAKLMQTGRSEWWIAVGVAFGLGMLSKYTTVFFAVSILIWLLAVPGLRKWLLTPWPWLSGLIALVLFSPTLVWNAEHGWASVFYQYRRLVVHEWSLRYLGEFFAAEMGLATPPIFVLGTMGLVRLLTAGGTLGARMLISAMVWPLALYFIWHTFHGRVEGNWPEPLYPAFVIAAAVAAHDKTWPPVWQRLASLSEQLAVPVGLVFASAIYVQAIFGIIPLGHVDPTARALGVGWKELAAEIDHVREQMGSPVILTTAYGLTAWLTFYLQSPTPVVQITERMRYVNAPDPDPELFRGTMTYLCQDNCPDLPTVRARFRTAEPVTQVARTRRGVAAAEYTIYRLADPVTEPLDPF